MEPTIKAIGAIPPPVDLEHFMEAVGGSQEEARVISDMYTEQARGVFEKLATAVREHSLTDIEHLAHRLAGCSASCGMSSLVETLRQMEHLARENRLTPDLAGELLCEARKRYDRVEAFLSTAFGVQRQAVCG